MTGLPYDHGLVRSQRGLVHHKTCRFAGAKSQPWKWADQWSLQYVADLVGRIYTWNVPCKVCRPFEVSR